jgi:hypothetical protein
MSKNGTVILAIFDCSSSSDHRTWKQLNGHDNETLGTAIDRARYDIAPRKRQNSKDSRCHPTMHKHPTK